MVQFEIVVLFLWCMLNSSRLCLFKKNNWIIFDGINNFFQVKEKTVLADM